VLSRVTNARQGGNRDEISNELKRYNSFEECIIEDIRFHNYLSTVEIDFNYIYDKMGLIRSDLEDKKILTLQFSLVSELRFIGGLSLENLQNIENANWSLNEIALVKLKDNQEDLLTFNGRLNQISILWEGVRELNIIFYEFKILGSITSL